MEAADLGLGWGGALLVRLYPAGAGLWEGLGGPKRETKVSRTAGRLSGAGYELTDNVQHFSNGHCHASVYEWNIRFVYMEII